MPVGSVSVVYSTASGMLRAVYIHADPVLQPGESKVVVPRSQYDAQGAEFIIRTHTPHAILPNPTCAVVDPNTKLVVAVINADAAVDSVPGHTLLNAANAAVGMQQVGTILVTPAVTGGGGGFPAGVTLREPDGGRTYYATGFGGVPFSNTTAYPTSISYLGAPAGTVNYTNGWDDPKFFPMGGALSGMNSGSDSNFYLTWNWNTKWYSRSDSSLAVMLAAGISLMQGEDDMHLVLANNGGSLNAAVVALGMADETSEYPNAWQNAIGGTDTSAAGNPTAVLNTNAVTASGNTLHFASTLSSNGVNPFPAAGMSVTDSTSPTVIPGGTTVSSATATTVVISNSVTGAGVGNGDQIVFGGDLTHAMQSGRPWLTGLAATSFLVDQKLSGVLQTPLTTTFSDPSSVARRPYDILSYDMYSMSPARYADYWGSRFQNAVEGTGGTTGAAYTMMKLARGPNQGTLIDYFRNFMGGVMRPTSSVLQLGDGLTDTPYLIGFPEINWEAWSIVIHGSRLFAFFDFSVFFYNSGSGTPPVGWLSLTECNNNQSTSFTGTIVGNTLTVSGMTNTTMGASLQQLAPGMQITTGAGGPPFPIILAQTAFAVEGTFSAVASGTGFGTLTVTGLSGQIPVPSILDTTNGSPVITGRTGNNTFIYQPQISGPASGNGVYNAGQIPGGGPFTGTNWQVYCPGMNGTYIISTPPSGNVGPVSMTAKQSDPWTLGPSPSSPVPANTATGNYAKQVSATCGTIRDLAPVVNSRFALGYVLPSSNPIRYIFPSAVISGALATVPQGQGADGGVTSRNYFLSTGIDCCVHYYEGAPYILALSGETISTNTFLIFATTAMSEDTVGPISCTFNTADTGATSVTVIGEARSIGVSGGSFTDTFQYSWTVHIYRVNH